MPRRVPPSGEADELLAALAAVYREVDAAHAGSSCPASSDCCSFATTGREPYVTSLELLAIARAVARRGAPPPRARRKLPLLDPSRTCPLLGEDRRCTVYEARPLGCRTYYCGRATHEVPVTRDQVGSWTRRIRDLAARERFGGDLGRPMSRALQELFGPRR